MRACIVALFFCLLCCAAIGQSPLLNYRFTRIDVEAGLSQNQVNSIYKDETGFVWFGTQEGLNRYDGYAFTVFRHIQGNGYSLMDNMVTRLFGGPQQTLWVTTLAGIQVMDKTRQGFYLHTDSLLQSWHLPKEGLMTIVTAGDYFCFVYPGRIYLWKEGKVTTFKNWDATAASGVTDALAADKEGKCWIIYRNGLLRRVNPVNGQMLLEKAGVTGATGVSSLYVDSGLHCWLYQGGEANGLKRFNYIDGSIQAYNTHQPDNRLTNDLITGVAEVEGQLWVATDHGGVNMINRQTGHITALYNKEGDVHSLAQNSVISIFKDNTGIVWLGTYKKGACYYKRGTLPFTLYRNDPFTHSGLPFNDVNNFEEDAQGNLWIATNGGGLVYFNRAAHSFRTYRRPNGPDGDVVVGLCRDHTGRIWTGSYMGGLDVFDGNAFRHFHHRAADSGSLCDDRVFAIYEDRQQMLWVGTMMGLDRYNAAKGSFEHYGKILQDSLYVLYVSCLAEDAQGQLWVGTPQGIAIRNPVTGSWRKMTQDNSGLVFRDVNDIYRDVQGNMWVATRGGVSVLLKGQQRFISFGVSDGLPDEVALKIADDAQHRIWISTVRGLARVTLQQVNGRWQPLVTCYKIQDGLQGTAFNKYAGFKTSRGELIFGGADGFNMVDPLTIKEDTASVPVVITSLYAMDSKGNKYGLPSGRHQVLELPYRENSLTITFAALSYGNRGQNRYKYRLTGVQDKWVEPVGDLRTLSFTNLGPGQYTFEVMAANREGVWSREKGSIFITILPPFWQTGWAYTLYALALLGILLLSRSYLIRRTQARMALATERRDAERTRQLDEMKIKFFTNVSHELRTPLSLILSPLDQWLQHTGKQIQEAQMQMMHRNARRLLHLVNQLLDFRKMEMSELHLHPVIENIVPFLESTVNSFLDLSVQKHIQLCFRTDLPVVVLSFDRDKIERILFNLLSNAFKFTLPQGTIKVGIHLQEEVGSAATLHIKVSDTGIGITKEAQQQIFTPFYQENLPAGMLNQGSGIGLSISREFARLHGGDIVLESEPGKGSCFTVRLPVAVHADAGLPAILPPPEKRVELAAGSRKWRNSPVVLLVEDNEDFRFYLKDNLAKYYQVIVAENGREGWQKALSLHPAVIISDVSMPVMDGIELCRKLKEDKRTATIPVLLMTALTSEEYQLKGWKTGASGYLAKPFSVEVLHSHIQNLLEQQTRLQKQLQKQVTVGVAPDDVKADTPDEKFVSEALVLVQAHMGDPSFSVEALSRGLHMSRVAVYKKLFTLTGKAPLDFIRSVRLQRAALLLEKTDKTIAEIAYEVGFNDPKYFSRFFKSVYQVTPTTYMAEHRKNENEPPAPEV
jgi:signal transduction histidine kinase/ligand-binding sensor domain-containing protein/AraC-like DNA-binding protein